MFKIFISINYIKVKLKWFIVHIYDKNIVPVRS